MPIPARLSFTADAMSQKEYCIALLANDYLPYDTTACHIIDRAVIDSARFGKE